ncbi:flagellar export chaperone FliS [Thermodesulfobacteriota bacterium]
MNALAQNAYAAYRKKDVETLRPVEIVSRLYSTLLLRLRTAEVAIDEGKVAEKGEAIGMAFAILGELQSSLDMEQGGEIAANLNDLYGFLFGELTFANLQNDKERLAGAIKAVVPLVEAWAELASTGGNPTAVEQEEDSATQGQPEGGSIAQSPLGEKIGISLSAVL